MSKMNEESPAPAPLSEDTLAAITAQAALEVKGIVRMDESLNRRGVRFAGEGSALAVDLYVICAYGTKIPQLAWRLQKYVAARIRTATGTAPKEINIHVQGVEFEEKHSEETESFSD